MRLLQEDMLKLTRVQAVVRGFLQRGKYRTWKIESELGSRYFAPEEARETLSSNVYKADAPLEERSYTYRTGAVYEGQWRGGIRHGRGTMKWPAGSCYTGEWQYN